jgi:hypothetical protein
LTPYRGPFMLRSPMWGYAEGNATVVGIVVAVIAAAAVAYVARGILRRRRGK